jgi:putative thiamine transport system ATP-binding protein
MTKSGDPDTGAAGAGNPCTATPSRAAPGALHLEDVRLFLSGRSLFVPLTVTVAPGEVTTVMGPSGCGKSSLLSFLCGTLDAAFTASGRVLSGSRDITALAPEERHLGILFQDDLLFPHLSVEENLAFGLPPRYRGHRIRRQAIERALESADLGGFAARDPATLSGGQRARVALLRTLLSEPQALLLDEPFAKLDKALRSRIRSFVFSAARRDRLPVLLVTHDPEDAEAAGGPVLTLATP